MSKKIIYALKDDGNNYSDESVVELHESKANAERSMEEHQRNHPRQQFWIDEEYLFLDNV